jgi:hypothetical protein
MIWYAAEILLALAWVGACFLIYRLLVNSSRFTQFIERTSGTDETRIGDIDIKISVAEHEAEQVAKSVSERIKRDAAALRRFKRRGSA